jgi:glutathione peroxidase
MRVPAVLLCAASLCGCADPAKETTMKSVYEIKVETIGGESVALESYRGKVLLVVNTASRCGFTKQYAGLQKLYDEHRERGFVVLGFPSNDFMKQEPGSNEQIGEFCRVNYGVEFPMFAKIAVKGEEQHPLYAWLTSETTNPQFAGKISWNFNKFLVSRDGRVIGRFGSRTEPQDAKLVAAVKAALATGPEEKINE